LRIETLTGASFAPRGFARPDCFLQLESLDVGLVPGLTQDLGTPAW
jgi:hypothetical protein